MAPRSQAAGDVLSALSPAAWIHPPLQDRIPIRMHLPVSSGVIGEAGPGRQGGRWEWPCALAPRGTWPTGHAPDPPCTFSGRPSLCRRPSPSILPGARSTRSVNVCCTNARRCNPNSNGFRRGSSKSTGIACYENMLYVLRKCKDGAEVNLSIPFYANPLRWPRILAK